VHHPSVILILGHRGSGKSALALRLQELLRDIAPPYGVGLPAKAKDLLPEWYGLEDDPLALPPNAIIYIPESYRLFHARTTQSAQGRAIGDLVNLSRHRRHTLIFDVQNAAHLDRNIISEADLILVKEPGPFQQGFERSELKSVMDSARSAFAAVGERRRRRAVWVATASDAGQGQLMENQLPTFWSNALSTIFGAGGLQGQSGGSETATPRRGRSTPLEAKRQKAQEMKAGGYSYTEIAKALGISKTYAYKLVNGQGQGQSRGQTPANPEHGAPQLWNLDGIGEQIKRAFEEVKFPPHPPAG
jgi:nucleoside-triphosphatase THEP1